MQGGGSRTLSPQIGFQEPQAAVSPARTPKPVLAQYHVAYTHLCHTFTPTGNAGPDPSPSQEVPLPFSSRNLLALSTPHDFVSNMSYLLQPSLWPC